MRTLRLKLPLLILFVVTAQLAATTLALADDASEERKTSIFENLRLRFPQLADMNVTMGELEPTEFAGLDHGSFVVNGEQIQQFLVSRDDTKLYLISGEPIDVSLSMDEIAAEVARVEAAKAQEAAARIEALAQVIAGRPVRGKSDAPVTVVEFSDFQCPFCLRGAETMAELLASHPEDVKFVFLNFPLGFHPWARPAAIAAQCAAAQSDDAFWLLHDRYFANQKNLNPDNLVTKSKEFLAESDIDLAAWQVCAEDESSEAFVAAAAVVDADMVLGQQLGISGTPGFFVDGHLISGAQPAAAFEPFIEKTKKE